MRIKAGKQNLRSSSRAFAEVTSAAFFLEENRLKTDGRFAAASLVGISCPATNNGNDCSGSGSLIKKKSLSKGIVSGKHKRRNPSEEEINLKPEQNVRVNL